MVVQPIGPTFMASAAPKSPVKESSKVQWPEFKVTQPDPVLGKNLIALFSHQLFNYLRFYR